MVEEYPFNHGCGCGAGSLLPTFTEWGYMKVVAEKRFKRPSLRQALCNRLCFLLVVVKLSRPPQQQWVPGPDVTTAVCVVRLTQAMAMRLTQNIAKNDPPKTT